MATSRNGTTFAITLRCSTPSTLALAFLGLLETDAVAVNLKDLEAMGEAIDECDDVPQCLRRRDVKTAGLCAQGALDPQIRQLIRHFWMSPWVKSSNTHRLGEFMDLRLM